MMSLVGNIHLKLVILFVFSVVMSSITAGLGFQGRRTFDVRRFGARANGRTDDTKVGSLFFFSFLLLLLLLAFVCGLISVNKRTHISTSPHTHIHTHTHNELFKSSAVNLMILCAGLVKFLAGICPSKFW